MHIMPVETSECAYPDMAVDILSKRRHLLIGKVIGDL